MTAFCFLVPTTNPFALVRVRRFGLRVRSSSLCLSLLELRAERLSSASRIPSLFYVCFAFGGAGTRFFRLLQASHSLLHAPTAHFLVISTETKDNAKHSLAANDKKKNTRHSMILFLSFSRHFFNYFSSIDSFRISFSLPRLWALKF